MNTPAHLVIGLAAFGRPGRPRVTAAAFLGALVPDASLYMLAGGALAAGIPPRTVFGELYYSDAWQAVFAVDNSIPLWGLLLAAGLALRLAPLLAAAGAALLHLAGDILLHADDGRPHFWPFSDWVFASPVSYWDRRHYGDVVAPIEVALTLALCLWLWRRFASGWMRALIAALAAAQAVPGVMWAMMF